MNNWIALIALSSWLFLIFGMVLAYKLAMNSARKRNMPDLAANLLLRSLKAIRNSTHGLSFLELRREIDSESEDVQFCVDTLVGMGFIEEIETSYLLTRSGRQALEELSVSR